MSFQNDVPAAQKLPAEIWLQISKEAPKSSDLHGLAFASRHFSTLLTSDLHRDLIWDDKEQATHNLEVWRKDATLASRVRSLVIAVDAPRCTITVENGALVTTYDTQGSGIHLWARVQTFTNLSSLTFKRMYLSARHFHLLHSLNQLRSLALIRCVVDDAAADGFDNRMLPITELTVLNVYPGPIRTDTDGFLAIEAIGLGHVASDRFANVLSIATAANLTTLTVDSTDVFRRVFMAPRAEALGWTPPASLEHLYVQRTHTITAPDCNGRVDSGMEAVDSWPLYKFCSLAPSLKTISTPSAAPSPYHTTQEMLPPGLVSFAGPLFTAQFVAACRNLKALGVLDCSLRGNDAIVALVHLTRECPGLEVLVFEVDTWDAEIVAAASENLKQLRRLRLTYEDGGPDENYLVKLGAESLSRMPELRTLEMYKLPPNGGFKPEHPTHLFDSTWGSIEEEMHDIVVSWNDRCPMLRRVQIVSGYAMARAFEGALWNMDKVECLEQIEYLNY